MFTVSKEDFKITNKLNIFGGIYDSYDFNFWHSEFAKDYSSIQVTKVENPEFDPIRLDTTQTTYSISKNKAIVLTNNKKPEFKR